MIATLVQAIYMDLPIYFQIGVLVGLLGFIVTGSIGIILYEGGEFYGADDFFSYIGIFLIAIACCIFIWPLSLFIIWVGFLFTLYIIMRNFIRGVRGIIAEFTLRDRVGEIP